MLPNAQAILFLLSADAGVTASDMEIWQKYIQPLREDGHSSLFAVLNKIDVLWDDLSGERFVQNAIRLIQDGTARQLGLQRGDAAAVGEAGAAGQGPRRTGAARTQSPGSAGSTTCERIVAQKEALLENAVLGQVLGLLHNSQHLLRLRLEKVEEQRALLDDKQRDSGQLLFELTAKTKDDHGRHHRRLLNLKTNQRLLQHQGATLRETIRSERMEQHLQKVRRNLNGSLTTVGINQAILAFFRAVEHDLDNLEHEAGMANRMVAAIYRRHNEENPLYALDAPQLRVQRYQRELLQLKKKGDQFRLQLKTVLYRATPADPALLRHPGAGGGRPAPALARGNRALGQRRADAADAAHPGKQTVARKPHAPPQGPGPGDPAGTPAQPGLRRVRRGIAGTVARSRRHPPPVAPPLAPAAPGQGGQPARLQRA